MKKRLPQFMAIRQLRNELKMTQEALAEKAGISVQYVRQIEGGYSAISDEIKRRLAAALDYSVWALFPEVRMKVDLFSVLESRFGDELIITEKEMPMFKEVLSQLSHDQSQDRFEELIVSGMTSADVKKKIRSLAKEMDIEVI